MALKIKKIITNDKGQIEEELEGTEAEIENYLKKRSKKQETTQKKKNLILGKEMRAAIQEMIDDALNKTAQFSQSKVVEHHWYHNNGWWWRPTWVGGNYVYQATQYDPNRYVVASSNFVTCNTAQEMGSHIGLDATHIANTIKSDPPTQSITTTGGIQGTTGGVSGWYTAGVNTNCAAVGAASTYVCDTNNALTVDNISSGIINLNIKS
jgi:hypothetical protein